MLRIVLIQPGSTDFDEEGRIKGSLDIPLSRNGADQVERVVQELARLSIDVIYTAPCQSAVQTAEALARERKVRVKRVDKFRNLDHGLWHGKLIEEVRQNQPKVYRHCQEHPDQVCPPQGESVAAAQARVQTALSKILKRHRDKTVALIVPEPLASFVRGQLQQLDFGGLWKAEQDCCHWTLIEMQLDQVPIGS